MKLYDLSLKVKKRYLYSLLFAIPGLFIAAIISIAVVGAVTGFLWIYVYGDMPWPASIDKLLPIIFTLTFLTLWIISIAVGFVTGMKLEKVQVSSAKHILISMGLTIVPITIIFLHQLSVGNIGQKTDGILCSEFCSQNGYSGSGMPPRNSGERNCFCYDDSGSKIKEIPIDNIVPKSRGSVSIDMGKQVRKTNRKKGTDLFATV